jgi:cupin fold WbuC family metalloprotein
LISIFLSKRDKFIKVLHRKAVQKGYQKLLSLEKLTIYNKNIMLKKITTKELEELQRQSKQSPRKRMNFNFHEYAGDTLQRMLHALQPGTYIQPHKHENPDKREVFIILTGRAALIEYDNTGRAIDHILLDAKEGNFAVEIPPSTWHSLIALEEDSVVYEIKDGPYSPADDKNFAAWAPREGDKECAVFLNKIIEILDLK